jgi:hypothetical protein
MISDIQAFLFTDYQYLITFLLCVNCGQNESYLPNKPNDFFDTKEDLSLGLSRDI